MRWTVLNNKVQWSVSCNRRRKKQILGYCCVQSIVLLTTDTSMSWLRILMFMYFELHWQRTSGVPFYQRRGTKTRTRCLDIKQLSAVLGDRLSQALIGFHSFTGCDSVSSLILGAWKDGTAEATEQGQTSHGHIHQPRQVVWCYTAGVW